MRTSIIILAIVGAAPFCVAPPARAADDHSSYIDAPMGTKELLRVPAVPPLHLSEADRARVRLALRSKDTEIGATSKAGNKAAGFAPRVGAKVPKALKAHPLPRPLVYDLPVLKRYTYLKFDHQVLIVNPLTHTVADVFPES